MDLLKINDFVDSSLLTRVSTGLPKSVEAMLYKAYNVLDACELFEGNNNDYKRNTYKINHQLDKKSLESLGLDVPSLETMYDCYVTKLDNIVCIYAHASFDLTGYYLHADVKDVLPLARGKDLQSLYEFSIDRLTNRLHIVIAQFCLNAPAITNYLIDWGIVDVSPQFFRKFYEIVMKAAEQRFKCETASEFEFEEVD